MIFTRPRLSVKVLAQQKGERGGESLMLKLVFAQVRAHKGRYAASALAIMIAVAFIVTTIALATTVERSITDTLGMQYRGTDAVVHGTLTPSDISLVRTAPGVEHAAAEARVHATTALPGGDRGWAWVDVLPSAGPLRWQTLTDGRFPSSAGEVVAGSTSGLTPGTVITVASSLETSKSAQFTVVGVADLRGSPQAMNGATLYASEPEVLALGAPITSIRVAGDISRALDVLREKVPDAMVQTGEQATAAAAQEYLGTSGLLRNVLLAFGMIAVAVGVLVIANTFSVVVASRTRHLALLRAVGATRGQVRGIVLAEATVIGFWASAAGVATGIAAAFGLRAAGQAADLPIPVHAVSVPVVAILAGVGIGVSMSLIAAHAPAQAATRVSPLAALRPLETVGEAPGTTRLRRIAGVCLALAGAAALAYGAAHAHIVAGCVGGLLVCLAVAAFAPHIVPAGMRRAGRLLPRFAGTVGELAARNAARNPRRTTAMALSLVIGVTLTATLAVGADLAKVAAAESINEELPVDIVITTYDDADVSELTQRLSDVQRVTATAVAAQHTVRGPAGEEHVVYAVDADFLSVLRSEIVIPQQGTAVFPRETTGLPDSESVTTEAGSALTVLHGAKKQIALITSDDARHLAPQATVVAARLADDLDADALRETQQHIAMIVDEIAPGAEIGGTASSRAVIDTIVDTMIVVVAGVSSVAILIALIGVANTMMLSVIERRRELALLRVAGLHKLSVGALLMWEAALVAAIAVMIGCALGVVLGTAGTAAVFGIDKVFLSALPVGKLVAIALVAPVATIAAALVPARRAIRTPPVDALGPS